jgi:hypothetical protein
MLRQSALRFILPGVQVFALRLVCYILLGLFAFRHNDFFLKRLWFRPTAGVVELLADCWLVKNTGTLVYPTDEPMIACSLCICPFAWAVILIQIGYLGWLISNTEKMWISMLCTTVIGFAVIPLFEHWAKNAGWWYYQKL